MPDPHQSELRFSSGFSLLELLVVTALILLLLSILVGALSRSRDLAHMVTCKSNLRNQYIACIDYAKDHDWERPPIDYVMGNPETGERHITYFGTIVTKAEDEPIGMGHLVDDYLNGQYEHLLCPSELSESQTARMKSDWETTSRAFSTYFYEWVHVETLNSEAPISTNEFLESISSIRFNTRLNSKAMLLDANFEELRDGNEFKQHQQLERANIAFIDGVVLDFPWSDGLVSPRYEALEVYDMMENAHHIRE